MKQKFQKGALFTVIKHKFLKIARPHIQRADRANGRPFCNGPTTLIFNHHLSEVSKAASA